MCNVQANKRRSLCVLQTPLCHVAISPKGISTMQTLSQQFGATVNRRLTSQKRERKNWQTIFFLLRSHRQMCLESLAMKNGCLVAGFEICQRHKVQHQHTMPTEAVATCGLVIFIIFHSRPSRNRQIGCCL